jgi:molybdenum cofactor cytidylyltransferase
VLKDHQVAGSRTGSAPENLPATVLVLPADMPFVRPETARAIIAESQRLGSAVVPIYRSERGHPIALPASLCAAILKEDVCSNLKSAFASAGAERAGLDVDDPGVVRDVDTTGDLTPGPPRAR